MSTALRQIMRVRPLEITFFQKLNNFCARVVVSKQRYILARGCYFRNNFMLKFVERMARLWYHQYEKVNMYEQVEMNKVE